MTISALFLTLAVCLALAMASAWAIVVRGAKSGWIDAIWSFATGSAGVAAALMPVAGWPTFPARQWLVAALIAFWGLRLATHIARRTRSGGEDPRYARLRQEWGANFRVRLLIFLEIQAGAGLLLAFAVFLAAHNPQAAIRATDLIGLALVVVAVGGEALADAQLARFRSHAANKGKVCDVGLWGLSRHPNYFFEWLGWLGIATVAVDLSGGYAIGWLALVGPGFMYWLLVYVSGIPPLEAHMLASRGDAFREYQDRVNAFWPVPRERLGARGGV